MRLPKYLLALRPVTYLKITVKVAWQLVSSSAFELLLQRFQCFEVCPYVLIYVTLLELLIIQPSCLNYVVIEKV